MPRGDKSRYTDKQKRKAAHIAEGYEARGLSEKEAEARAWRTVNAIHGGGEKSGSGRGKPENKEPYRRGGRKGGAAKKPRSTARKSTAKKATAKKATAKKATAKKSTAKKRTTRKATAKKSTAKKAPAKKRASTARKRS